MSKNPRLKDGFGQVSSLVIKDPAISLRDKAVYAYLSLYADSESNSLFVSVNRIAADLNITPSTVKRSIKSLMVAGVISRYSNGIGKSHTTILLK
jgi:predicted transcriptional regulator